MADWEHEDLGRGGPRDRNLGAERDWRGGRDWRDKNDLGPAASRHGGEPNRPESRSFGDEGRFRDPAGRDPGERNMRQARDERPRYGRDAGPRRASGGERSYQESGDTAFGQMANGSSDSGLGGYGGADVGGWGQPNLNSQWGQGGYAPLNQGIDYGQDGGRFTAAGYDASAYGPSSRQGQGRQEEPHDPHHVSYHHWRNTQLSTHDRDYARWREEQARRYDEDYGSWRNERHSAFSKEFEGWRAGRGGQSGVPASAQPATSTGSVASSNVVNPSERSTYGQTTGGQASASASAGNQGSAHGANPTLARIADGEDGHRHHDVAEKAPTDKDAPRR